MSFLRRQESSKIIRMIYYVYILASKRNGTLYVGVTNNLVRRVWEHKNKLVDGFTKRHSITMLVYFEETSDIGAAILREKQIKAWKREWKLNLIESVNFDWHDLYNEIIN